MKHVLIDGLCLKPGQAESALEAMARKRYGCDLRLTRIVKKSIDARKKGDIVIRYRAAFCAPDDQVERLRGLGAADWEEAPRPAPHRSSTPGLKVLILGSGPAGLFCALRLAERGLRPVILERGKKVAERDADIQRLKGEGILDPDSNVVFGEGGAGTYSDGKLTTRIRAEEIEWLFDRLVEHGADPSILYDTKPHIGTDRLSLVVTSIRERLEGMGAEFRFGETVTGVIDRDGRAVGLSCAGGAEYLADAVVLACGHSARALYEKLSEQGVAMEAKGFAVGVRIEHPAEFINRSQYGAFAGKLPAADYRLTRNNPANGRGCYSFCMCPGGEVINSSSEAGRLCVNGMSFAARGSAFSNSALVVSVKPEDCGPDALSGIGFQRELEARAFAAAGGGFRACVQNARSFLDGSARPVGPCSYGSRVAEADLSGVLPGFVSAELKLALADFDRVIPGFSSEGTLIGAETRTSSPVRVLRGEDRQSVSRPGLYPVGEGSGYSGGIVSSAVDGIRTADLLAEAVRPS